MNDDPSPSLRLIDGIEKLPYHSNPGEVYAVTGETMKEIVAELNALWALQDMLARMTAAGAAGR